MRLRRAISAAGAVIVSAALLTVMGFGFGGIPALGPALDPGRGAWTSAYGGAPVTSQALRVPGLDGPVAVSFTSAGLASITAGNSRDMFLALGYVHARYRLAEMDLERRLGEGRLAELAGPSDTKSDEFELRLGLLRTARNQWSRTTGTARAALLAYAQGVNDDIAQVRANGDWPALYSLAGVYPQPWTPVDSLVIQGVLTQELDYTTSPLDYAILERSLGAKNTMAWFPVLPANAGLPNTGTPYDPGPYVTAPLTPVAPDVASSALLGGGAPDGSAEVAGVRLSGGEGPGRSDNSGDVAQAAGALLGELSQLRSGQIHEYPDSNAWAVNGPAVARSSIGGGALLGGDPHLPQTLPSVWYEVALSAPGYQVAGATVPGVPGVLLGHNAHIAWSLTDTQNEATLYYAEKVRGDEYFWRDAWHPMTVEHYTIPVRGSSPVPLAVDITVHGPIMTQAGQTMAVDWMGNVPSDDLGALMGINQASNWGQFKAALSTWRAPTQNFTYADSDPVSPGSAGSGSASGGSGRSSPGTSTAGNIGVYAAGYYPQVPAGCQPWLPMSGTGGCDIGGVIPYSAIPQVYDPPSHVVATDNQRPVSASYPYYVGTSGDFYDPGYRAGFAYQSLDAAVGSGQVSAATIASLQNSVTDSLAASIVPRLLAVLRSAGPLPPAERSAASVLGSWDYSMSADSAAATVWWTFWSDYVGEVFGPWWRAGHVPAGKDSAGLKVGPGLAPLDEDLQAWTLAGPVGPGGGGAAPGGGAASGGSAGGGAAVTAVADATFRGPSGRGPADARAAMLAAFRQAAHGLSASLGGAASSWTWGRVHARAFPSVTGAAGLGYGPRATGGDPFVEDAADGGMTASTGPSWRMVATLAAPHGGGSGGGASGGGASGGGDSGGGDSGGGVSAEGVYPGGQSENPASPWYDNLVSLWWDGQYLPVPEPGSAGFTGGVRWALHG